MMSEKIKGTITSITQTENKIKFRINPFWQIDDNGEIISLIKSGETYLEFSQDTDFIADNIYANILAMAFTNSNLCDFEVIKIDETEHEKKLKSVTIGNRRK